MVDFQLGVKQLGAYLFSFSVQLNGNDCRCPGLNVIDGTHCTPEFLAGLAVDRYQLHLPVYREMIRLVRKCLSTV